jgi:hypothetical protein
MVFVKGGRTKSRVQTQQKNGLDPEAASLLKNTWPFATTFQPIAALGMFKPRGIKAMFWAHWEPEGRYVWSVRETRCVSPLIQRVFCCYSDCCVHIRGTGANFSEY